MAPKENPLGFRRRRAQQISNEKAHYQAFRHDLERIAVEKEAQRRAS